MSRPKIQTKIGPNQAKMNKKQVWYQLEEKSMKKFEKFNKDLKSRKKFGADKKIVSRFNF